MVVMMHPGKDMKVNCVTAEFQNLSNFIISSVWNLRNAYDSITPSFHSVDPLDSVHLESHLNNSLSSKNIGLDFGKKH